MIIVCKDCQKRYPGCHAECEWYKVELRVTHEENKRREQESEAGYLASSKWNYDKRGIRK